MLSRISSAPRPELTSPTPFADTVRAFDASALRRGPVTTLQVNLGKRCNMACLHCHVEAGPMRTEVMSHDLVARVLTLLERSPRVEVLDLTGGAPELNPSFRWLVREASRRRRRVVDRCNLTVLFEPGMEDLPALFAAHRVEVVASLPCYEAANVEAQRGGGAFDKSVEALRWLNRLGYGRAGTGLELSLVYNPVGAHLPPAQPELERTYRAELHQRFGIEFTRLLTITNMPIARFAHQLAREGKLEAYLELLVQRFNPATLPGLMCRSLASVSWDGRLFDCDFNQMLELPRARRGSPARTIWELESLDELEGEPIVTGAHCFGCTAGSGSSCSGSLA